MSSGREVSQPEWSPGSPGREGRQSLGPGDTVSGSGSRAASGALGKEQLEKAGGSQEGVLPSKERGSQEEEWLAGPTHRRHYGGVAKTAAHGASLPRFEPCPSVSVYDPRHIAKLLCASVSSPIEWG